MFVGFQFLAVLCCTLFSGAAIYINLVEHPARMDCDTKTAATAWAPSYKRATVMQAPLAALSFLAGVGAWLFWGGMVWLIGAVLIGLVIPFTFIVVRPTHHDLSARARDRSSIEIRSLLAKWGRLHALRTVVISPASIVYLLPMFGSGQARALLHPRRSGSLPHPPTAPVPHARWDP